MNEQHHTQHNHHYRHPWPFLQELEKMGDEYLIRKAPWQLPHKWKQIIAKILPIVALIIAIISLPGILGGILYVLGIAGHSAANRGFYNTYWSAAYPIILIQLVITIVVTWLYFKSFDHLRKRHYVGWVYVFYAWLLGLVANLLDGGVVSMIAFILTMYLLFQSKELYH